MFVDDIQKNTFSAAPYQKARIVNSIADDLEITQLQAFYTIKRFLTTPCVID
jgi:hypothetical protein